MLAFRVSGEGPFQSFRFLPLFLALFLALPLAFCHSSLSNSSTRTLSQLFPRVRFLNDDFFLFLQYFSLYSLPFFSFALSSILIFACALLPTWRNFRYVYLFPFTYAYINFTMNTIHTDDILCSCLLSVFLHIQ